MPEQYEISTLLVVVPLGAVAFAVLLWRLHRGAGLTLLRVGVCGVLCVYLAGVIANSVFPIVLGGGGDQLPWWVGLNLVPLVNTDLADMLQNVLVFAPLGMLLPLVARVDSLPRVLLWGFLLSLTMEVLQFANAVTAHGGHVADINDLLANTIGAPIGYGVFRLARLVPAVDRLIRAATWPAPR